MNIVMPSNILCGHSHIIETEYWCYSVTYFTHIITSEATYVSGSSKIQTLCHLTQVQLKLRFTAMETLSGY